MKTHVMKAALLTVIFVMLFSLGHIPASSSSSAEPLTKTEVQISEIPENTVRIHYQREDNNFAGLGLWLWEDVAAPSQNWPSGGTPFIEEQVTDYGAYLDIELKKDARKLGFLVLNTTTGDKDGEDKNVELLSPQMNEVWIKQGSDEVFLAEPAELPENTMRIHYQREDGNYDGWGTWIWGDAAVPSEKAGEWPDGATTAAGVGKHGVYFDVEVKENAEEIGFLFVNKATADQTMDYRFSMLQEHRQLFVKDGDAAVYTNPYGSIPAVLLSGELLSETKIQLRFSSTKELTADVLKQTLTVADKDGNDVMIDSVSVKNNNLAELHGVFDLTMAPFYITYGERTVTADGGWRLLDEMYGYDGELGATLHGDGTALLKLWSPTADSVSVVLYDKHDQHELIATDLPMTLGSRGVWEITLNKENTGLDSLRGFYYHYKITHGEETKLALDPYAKSMAAWINPERGGQYPIGKAAIVAPSSVGPKLSFAEIDGFEKREDAVIYEVHVRDFTSDPDIEAELNASFGTFTAFIDKLDYIESLGVTHIQLLPVMNYYWVDETAGGERMSGYSSSGNNYNWGYDPHSYFSLTGMYSENPDDPELRLQEFKLMIDEIHRRGMGVILDVVYNHTAKVEIFEDLVPHYYHFMDADGTPRTSFGGGRLGTTHQMARRIVVDSIAYWTETYKVDGFRFDMMGDHDAETIQLAYEKAKEINPDVIMIGEGWRTFVGDEGDSVMPADQDWMQHTESVGVFSDDFRNEVKSGYGHEGEPRFITGGARKVARIFDNLKAQPHNFTASDPGDVVPYIEAHDNLTLHDVIAIAMKKDPDDHQKEIHKRIRIGNTLVLTSQGTAFIHAGQEYGRTKQFREETNTAPYKSTYGTDEHGNPFVYPYFIHDSYDSSDAVNKFDWAKATDSEKYPIHTHTREYTAGLIALRRSTDAFRLGAQELVETNVTLVDVPEISEEDVAIAYRNEATNGDAYYVFVNADIEKRTFTLKEDITVGEVLADSDEAGTTEVSTRSGFDLTPEKITIDPLMTVIVKLSAEEENPVDPLDPADPDDSDVPEKNPPQQPDKGMGDGEKPEEPSGTDPAGNAGKSNSGKSEAGETAGSGDEKLPETATSFYSWLLTGIALFLLGSAAYFVQKGKPSGNN
ncbi:pullulanase, extracellular [Evansella caseinilytica]|uniref:pullulanase n=1 Tax=Evansella caseinilytica TaxID=1503961 RepID=A0A1H3UG68_9BACI|nr:pullulanase [Evansella caseinilytica]SDZ61277.1 pullulanase, extracellular [Evansella caseinilytica]